MRWRRGAAAGAAWLVGLGLMAAALRWAGHGPLAGPPLGHPGRWGAWLDGRAPVVAAFALVRLAAVATLWYVVGATVVGALLRLAGAASLVGMADRVTIGPVRRLLAGSLSLGLAGSGLLAVAAPALRAPVAAAEQPAPTTTTTTTVPAPATVTMHRLGNADAPAASAAPAAPAASAAPAAPAVVAPVARAEAGRWTVRPGQCFWSIAESVLTERLGRPPSDAEIVPYWLRLIDANRATLVHAADPDLILPGQVFQVPPT